MYWRENDHPRSDDGRFTFKNGSSVGNSKKNPAEVLYSKTATNKNQEKEKTAYRDKLLNTLGNKATPADILYGDIDELERKVKGIMTGGASNVKNQTGQTFTRPVEGIIRSDYGPRKQPTPGASTYHKGIDFRAPIGTPVKSIASGTVIKSGKASGYGTAVYIDHGIINGKRVISEYGHLSKCDVKVGDKVNAGQVVAKSGNSGVSQAPHLHLTIKENGQAVDPKKYLNFK